MSFWTYINGVITVSPMGRTQPERKYILETVLSHLPKVSGSGKDISVQILQKPGYNRSCMHDEFFQKSNLGKGKWGTFEYQDDYFLIVNADLRDREFEETHRKFIKWLCRLAKRVSIRSVLIRIEGYDKKYLINESRWDNPFRKMYEEPSWINDDSKNWCEYLIWGEKRKG